ncbi:hypothetical protein AC249_AIPGENE7882 [Exaiptasia diaphana]|nr:hypothetical protein AC249_AIPGENE7882 [Exaiptasia diaphana]
MIRMLYFISLGGNSNPKAYLKPSSKSLFLGESFNFSCHAFGDAIVFTWLKNNQSVPSGMVSALPSRPHQGYTHFMSILTIKKAQKSNAGTYKCRISSSRQPGYSNDATAIVRIIEYAPEAKSEF